MLSQSGRRLLGPEFGKALWESLLEQEWGGGFEECRRAAEAAFPAAKVDLARIRTYLSSLAADAGDFFDYLKVSLQP